MITTGELHASYDPVLVVLSVLLAVCAAYAALELAGRVSQTRGRTRNLWLTGGALAMGVGIWSMHFTGMLAFHMDLPVRYDIPTTLGALAIAVLSSGLALFLVGRRKLQAWHVLTGGGLLGLGIVGMNLTGMAAMRVAALIQFNPALVALSAVLAVGAAQAALWLAFKLHGDGLAHWTGRKIGSAAAMGLAICGMHYITMQAARFTPTDISLAPLDGTMGLNELDAAIVGFGTLLLLGFALLNSYKANLYQKDRALDRARRELAGIVECCDDAIKSVTLDGIITSWNPGCERLFGYTAAEAIGRPHGLLMPPDRQDEPQRFLERVVAGESVRGLESVVRAKDGSLLDVSLTISPLRDENGELIGISTITRDITGLKRAQTELIRRTAELEDANAQLEQADRYKDEFLGVISHELRTPLNFITGFASVLEDEVFGPLNPKQADSVGKILRGADRMLTLVNELLDLAKIQAGRLEMAPEPTDYHPVVEEVFASLWPLAEGKRIALTAEVDVEHLPSIDGLRMVQVLTNLVSNAIKFTPEGGRVHIRAYEQGDRLVTEVSDTGPGIATEDVAKLFQKFSQLDMSATRQEGGTGLGLAISKALVEAHGGSIGILSKLEEGSTFWYSLPLVLTPATTK